ncbi:MULTISPECIES: hypothetical protein [unclassified Cytobacillus]|uniref:hypothetical protein n=1 Tax=unclassified Cytobacillus TaxID=2675268 RepID=UPI0013570DD0|nr:hypothetical protein [Cytobacillus sp. AMY 15.2]KAF0820228.1 hypothetical protein KIS4809_0808 [Bacillus sp. ZZV12-4809]MCM3089459.1 hypothetical protein [Cytobacillus sp. AMY 15.2]
MVTAIVIPIICLYFFWLTKKEMRDGYERWAKLADVPEEAIITGEIVHLSERRQRYHYSRYVHVLELTVQTKSFKYSNIKKITPIMYNTQTPSVKIGDHVHLYGNWKDDFFQVGRIQITPNRKEP